MDGIYISSWQVEAPSSLPDVGGEVWWDIDRSFDGSTIRAEFGDAIAGRVTGGLVPEQNSAVSAPQFVGTVTAIETLWCRYAPGPLRAPTDRGQPIYEPVPGTGVAVPGTSSGPPEPGMKVHGYLVDLAPSSARVAIRHDPVRDRGVFGLLAQLRFEEAYEAAGSPGDNELADAMIALCASLVGDIGTARRLLDRRGTTNVFTGRAASVLARRAELAPVVGLDASQRGRVALLTGSVLVVEDADATSGSGIDLVALVVGRIAAALTATGIGPLDWRPDGAQLAKVVAGALADCIGVGSEPADIRSAHLTVHPVDPLGTERPIVIATDAARGDVGTGGPTGGAALVGVVGQTWMLNSAFDASETQAAIVETARRCSADGELVRLVEWRLRRRPLT